MESAKNITGGTALVCDPSFVGFDGQDGVQAFPMELLDKLSCKFNFQVVGVLDTMPIVFIHANGQELSAIDAYLEKKYGTMVSVEGPTIIQTDITSSPT